MLGILATNILNYAQLPGAHRWLRLIGEPSLADKILWALNYLFIDGKLRGLFALLFGATAGRHFWSTGYAWGTCTIAGDSRKGWNVSLNVVEGQVALQTLVVGTGRASIEPSRLMTAGESLTMTVR